jgi:predicted dehydrogenase
LIHDLTVLDWLFESKPDLIRVHDTKGPFPPGELLSAKLEYSGVPVRINARTDWPIKQRSFALKSGNYYFSFDGIEETLTVNNQNVNSETDRVEFEALPLTSELRHFVRTVNGLEEKKVTQKHVLRVMETMEELENKASDAH